MDLRRYEELDGKPGIWPYRLLVNYQFLSFFIRTNICEKHIVAPSAREDHRYTVLNDLSKQFT